MYTKNVNLTMVILNIFYDKKISAKVKVEACIVDLICRRCTGKALPEDCLREIMSRSRCKDKRRHRRRVRKERKELYVPDYNERGARVKRLKSKVRMKRAWRLQWHKA